MNIVLFEPEMPANTGNIGRTCVATDTKLHLIEPLGLSLIHIYTGLRSRLWKVVTVDGKETERTVLHTDTYNASKAIYAVGPAAAPPTEAPAPVETSPAETEPQVAAPVEGVDGGPGVSAPQQSAEAPAAGPGSEAPEAAAPAPQPETAAPQPSAEVPAPQPETPADNGGGPA